MNRANNKSNNKIEPTAFVGSKVQLGKNNYIGHFTFIDGDVVIGDNNHISHHVVIGSEAQNSVHRYEFSGKRKGSHIIKIGSNNVIREFSTVHLPMESETHIDDRCYLMSYSHVPHDAWLCEGVILSNNAQIGGFTRIMPFANIGLSTTIHQFSTIGSYCMLGMGTVVTRDIPPFVIAIGNPARFTGKFNVIGLERNGFTKEEIDVISNCYSTEQFDRSDIPERVSREFGEFKEHSKRAGLVSL